MTSLRLTRRSILTFTLLATLLLISWCHYPTTPGHAVQSRLVLNEDAFLSSWNGSKSAYRGTAIDHRTPVHDFDNPPLPTTDVNISRTLYHLFLDQPEHNPNGFDLRPFLMDVPILKGICLDGWLTHGVIQPGCRSSDHDNDSHDSHSPLWISFVHTYLNGSDPLWLVNKRAYSVFTSIGRTQGVPDRHYRDHGELRASLRARAKAFDHLSEDERRSVDSFIVMADWPVREDGQEEELSSGKNKNMMDTPLRRLGRMDERSRVGQVPAWFDMSDGAYMGSEGILGDGYIPESKIKIVWHSQMWNSFSLAAPFQPSNDGFDSSSYRKSARDRFGKDLVITSREGMEALSIRRQAVLRKGLPTFNSFSIESMLWNTPGVSAQYVYMNDDFFLLAPHNPTDFHTPSSIYGPIVPFIFAESNYTNAAKPKWPPKPPRDSLGWFRSSKPYQDQNRPPSGGFVNYPATSALSCNHEWASLTRANRMLGLRFGLRQRPGHMHIPKPVLAPLMHEVGLIWGSDFAKSTTRRFREDGRTRPGDINAMFMSEMLLVERSREAMLWTWFVAKLGEEDRVPGRLGRRANLEIRRVLGVPEPTREPWFGLIGGDDVQEVVIPITDQDNRHTLRSENVKHALREMGQGPPLATEYGFTSHDGPLPPFGATVYNCSIVFYSCFGTWWTRAHANEGVTIDAAKLFKRIAFEQPHCGDCLLSGVIQASGKLGMKELLPRANSVYAVSGEDGEEHEQPHLSFAKTWNAADFSMEGVFRHGSWRGDVNLRQWCERLIARYTWTAAANSTAIFRMLNGFKSINDAFDAMDADPPPSCAVLNDDIPTPMRGGLPAALADKMSEKVTSWLADRWKEVGSWERKER